MKNLKHVVAITILATAVLIGCKKQMDDPILHAMQQESLFKGPGQTTIGDTIFVTSISVVDFIKFANNSNIGWNNSNYLGTGAKVVVKDQNGNFISGVNVTGQFTGCYSSTVTKKTDNMGLAQILGSNIRPSACTSTFTVMSVVKSGYYYDATKNIATSGSKVYP